MNNSDIRLQSKTGPIYSADANIPELRSGKNGELITGIAHANNNESVSRGLCFSASTAATGVAPGTEFSTTPPFTLHNPTGSGKNLVLIKTSIGFVSGTLGAGTIAYGNSVNAAAPSGGTAITPVSNLVGSTVSSVAKVGTGHTATAATILRPAFVVLSGIGGGSLVDEVNGEIIIIPGSTLAIEACAMGAGTSPLIMISAMWEEVTI